MRQVSPLLASNVSSGPCEAGIVLGLQRRELRPGGAGSRSHRPQASRLPLLVPLWRPVTQEDLPLPAQLPPKPRLHPGFAPIGAGSSLPVLSRWDCPRTKERRPVTLAQAGDRSPSPLEGKRPARSSACYGPDFPAWAGFRVRIGLLVLRPRVGRARRQSRVPAGPATAPTRLRPSMSSRVGLCFRSGSHSPAFAS